MSGFLGGFGLSAIPPVLPHPGMRTGSVYYFSPLIQPGSTANPVTNDLAYYQPFCLPGFPIDRIGIESTSGAGAARLGIYSNLNGTPDQLLLDAGIVDTSGIAISEISLSQSMYLPNAWFWMCVVFSSTPTIRLGTASNMFYIGSASTNTIAFRGLSATLAYGALPTQASVVSLANVAACPMFLLRKT